MSVSLIPSSGVIVYVLLLSAFVDGNFLLLFFFGCVWDLFGFLSGSFNSLYFFFSGSKKKLPSRKEEGSQRTIQCSEGPQCSYNF